MTVSHGILVEREGTAPDMMWISRNHVLKWKRRLGLDKNMLETLIRVWKQEGIA